MTMLRSTIFLVLAEMIFALSGYFIAAGLGRFLGPGEYGRYSLVIGFTTMIIILIGRGIPTAMAKRISENADNHTLINAIKATAARWQYSIITIATVIFYLSAPLLARGFGDITLVPLFELAAFVVPAFALSSFHVLYFNGLKRFGAMSALKMARGILRLGWIVGLAYFFGTFGAITGAIIAPLGVFVLALLIDRFTQNQNKKNNKTTYATNCANSNTSQITQTEKIDYPVRKLLTYAGGFMLFLLFYELFMRVDIYLIKRILGDDTAVGLYSAAVTIALIPYYLLYALALVMFPTISTITTKGNHHAGIMLSQILRLLLITLIPIGLLMILFAKPLTTLLFGAQFVASASLVPLLIGATIFGTIFYILAAAFNGAGATHIPTKIVAVGIFVGIGANVALLAQYGTSATAAIFSLTSIGMSITALIAARKVFGATISVFTILRIGLSIGILGTIVWGSVAIGIISTQIFASIIGMFVGGGALMISYFALLFLTGELRKSDLEFNK